MGKPKIAILMDENTSGDATRYEASKTYFQAIADAGGLPFGIPYLAEIVGTVVEEFDGLMTCGGRFAYPADWYIGNEVSLAPQSARFEIEKSIVQGFLARDKPILGMCAGMQMIACLMGCKLTPDLKTKFPEAQEHDKAGQCHTVTFDADSILPRIIGASTLSVNSFHQEAIAALSDRVVAAGLADDGIIEAIVIPDKTYVIGLQWHQEHFVGTDHAGNRFFSGLVEAAQHIANADSTG
ncbi:MAG: gamma-glutamyl-gamma-aminobutyrate hydrolase family protein [Paracoccaceae bacterium]